MLLNKDTFDVSSEVVQTAGTLSPTRSKLAEHRKGSNTCRVLALYTQSLSHIFKMSLNTFKMGLNTIEMGLTTHNGSRRLDFGSQHLRFWVSILFWSLNICKVGLNMCKMGLNTLRKNGGVETHFGVSKHPQTGKRKISQHAHFHLENEHKKIIRCGVWNANPSTKCCFVSRVAQQSHV